MANKAMFFYLVILSVILTIAFATNEKEAENQSTGIFGKVGRFVTVALAMSSRLGEAGASRGGGTVYGGEKAVANMKFNQFPNNNWMAPPPPMPMKSAEVNRRKASRINLKKTAEYLENLAQKVRKLTDLKLQREVPGGPDAKHHEDESLKQENRVAPGGPDAKHHEDESLKQENRVAPGGPDAKHHDDTTLKQENRVAPGGPDAKHH